MEFHFELQPVSQSTVVVIDQQLASNAAAIILKVLMGKSLSSAASKKPADGDGAERG